jgi:hypothetical protein
MAGIGKSSRRWAVLNYAVTEPNKWTAIAIAEDLGETFKSIDYARSCLTRAGFVALGQAAPGSRSRVLIPTPAGVEALYKSLGL